MNRKFLNFFNSLELPYQKVDDIRKYYLQRIPVSRGVVQPGDIIIFDYPDTYIALVVSTQRAPMGTFLSTRGNNLITTFKLPENKIIIEEAIRNLYKKRVRADYYTITKAFKKVFGPESFRTFNMSKIDNLYKLDLR